MDATQTRPQQTVKVNVDGLDAASIRSILLPTGWMSVQGARLTQFAVGTAHSPIEPTKLFPALSYQDENGKTVYTPLNQILSFSQEAVRR